MIINVIKNMSSVDSNVTTGTEVVNKEHEKFHLGRDLAQ